MRDAENESHEGKRKTESLWPIMRIAHTRSRYIYELYYKREAISKELYEWLLKEGYGDAKFVVPICHIVVELTPKKFDSQMEEVRLRETVLCTLHPNQGPFSPGAHTLIFILTENLAVYDLSHVRT